MFVWILIIFVCAFVLGYTYGHLDTVENAKAEAFNYYDDYVCILKTTSSEIVNLNSNPTLWKQD